MYGQPLKVLIGAGGSTAGALREAWAWCQERAGCGADGRDDKGCPILDRPLELMTGRAEAGAQKDITGEIEDYQAAKLEEDIRALDYKEQRRVAFLSEDYKHSTKRG